MLFWKAFFCCFKILFILERGAGREKERERNIDVQEISVASHIPPTGGLAHNLGMYPENRTDNL